MRKSTEKKLGGLQSTTAFIMLFCSACTFSACTMLLNYLHFIASNNHSYVNHQSITGISMLSPRASTADNNDNSIIKNETNNALIKAINTMRCFTTPGCYPSIKCLDGKPSMKIGVPHKWEHHSFCNSDMEKVKDNCLIYSFGLDKNIEWEKRMAKKYGCDVFGFDPTSNFPENAAEGVKFHKLGLVGAGVSARALADTHSILYDEIDPTQLRTLGDIMKFLGHEGRKIDILRLDCEGCEYGVLKQLACGGDSHLVNQLMIEFHFQKNLGIANDDDILIGADAINCLEEDRWGITSMEKRGCSDDDAQYTEASLKISKLICMISSMLSNINN